MSKNFTFLLGWNDRKTANDQFRVDITLCGGFGGLRFASAAAATQTGHEKNHKNKNGRASNGDQCDVCGKVRIKVVYGCFVGANARVVFVAQRNIHRVHSLELKKISPEILDRASGRLRWGERGRRSRRGDTRVALSLCQAQTGAQYEDFFAGIRLRHTAQVLA